MAGRRRVTIVVHGQVQGVGFRHFIWRLARQLRLDGEVRNRADGAVAEAVELGVVESGIEEQSLVITPGQRAALRGLGERCVEPGAEAQQFGRGHGRVLSGPVFRVRP